MTSSARPPASPPRHPHPSATQVDVTRLRAPLSRFEARLTLPLVAAPMFLVSGVEMVSACCRAGIIGSFPTANCRSSDELRAWMAAIGESLAAFEQQTGRTPAPVAPNLIVHRSNPRVQDDLRVLIEAKVEVVIASVGSPAAVIGPLHDAGCVVLADVASLRHAEKAIEAGADALVLLTAGAGGQTGWANPLAFARAVRSIWDGPLVMAGGISDGSSLLAARALGCDLGYVGTRLIACDESMAAAAYKQMLVASTIDDVMLTSAFTGLPTSMLRPSVLAAGLDPDNLPARGAIDISRDISIEARSAPGAKRWKDIWSAGHSVGGVGAIEPAAAIIARLREEYRLARLGLGEA